MAIELLPLLTDDSSPPVPGGEFVPPTASTSQEVVDVTAEYLDYLNPDLRPSSLAYMAWQESNWLSGAFSALWGGVKNGLDAASEGFSGIGLDVGRLWRETNDFVETIITGVGWEEGQPTVVERLEAIQAGGSNSWWGTVPFDATSPEWVLVDTDTFTDYTHFTAEAHVYLISLIAPIVSRSEEIIDGETVYFGAGWVAEMADTARGQRSYLDFEENIYHREGHLMRGVMVNLPKGGDGQVAAYKYTPA
jgi:hypothetical protein